MVSKIRDPGFLSVYRQGSFIVDRMFGATRGAKLMEIVT